MNRTDIILQLLANKETPIVGTTRLQKLLFLVEKEKHIMGDENDGSFDFKPYKFGPFSQKLCDDIEFLVNLGYIEKSGESQIVDQAISLDDIEMLKADDFLSSKSTSDSIVDEEDNENQIEVSTTTDDSIVYRIADKGIKYLKDNKVLNSNIANQIVQIKEKYGKRSLVELLQYTYQKYPEYTTESEIKDKIV